MVHKIYTCNRCGCIITAPHPDRITVYKHNIVTYKDYKGIEHSRSEYKTNGTIHLCDTCTNDFNRFLEGTRNADAKS